jgi:MoaA/NifB/PqqE/SkfB family radical SAM enzyme
MPALAWTPSARLKQAALERAQPLSASLELTYRCNWRCVFCYNPRHHDRRGLAAAEWGVVLDDLRVLGSLYVALTGGEPLTHPEFLAIARGVRERAFALRILTNGALVTDALAAEIAALRPLAVELSLHGETAETHDRATGTPGSFAAMLRGVDRLLARKVAVVLKTPLTRLNEAEMAGMRRIADERGVPWRVDPTLTPRDDGDTGPLAYRASAQAVERVFRELAAVGLLPHEARMEGGTNCGLGEPRSSDPEGTFSHAIDGPLGNVRDAPVDIWVGSAERLEASVARAANASLIASGGAVARSRSARPRAPAHRRSLRPTIATATRRRRRAVRRPR